jgi:hypothetical protein
MGLGDLFYCSLSGEERGGVDGWRFVDWIGYRVQGGDEGMRRLWAGGLKGLIYCDVRQCANAS